MAHKVVLGPSDSAVEAEVPGSRNSLCKGPETEIERPHYNWGVVRGRNERASDRL